MCRPLTCVREDSKCYVRVDLRMATLGLCATCPWNPVYVFKAPSVLCT